MRSIPSIVVLGLTFGLATPVVLWAGSDFHRNAIRNARHATATMDTLVSLGTLAAWGWSMGGYGALLLAQTFPGFVRSVAAFSPWSFETMYTEPMSLGSSTRGVPPVAGMRKILSL